jgi:hypothetical protein
MTRRILSSVFDGLEHCFGKERWLRATLVIFDWDASGLGAMWASPWFW